MAVESHDKKLDDLLKMVEDGKAHIDEEALKVDSVELKE